MEYAVWSEKLRADGSHGEGVIVSYDYAAGAKVDLPEAWRARIVGASKARSATRCSPPARSASEHLRDRFAERADPLVDRVLVDDDVADAPSVRVRGDPRGR